MTTTIRRLLPQNRQLAEYTRRLHSATAEIGTQPEDLFAPEYWAHVAANFTPRDKIEVWAEDGSWYVELLVLSASRTEAKVELLLAKDFGSTARVEVDDNFTVEWKGAVRKYCIVRTSDKAIIKDGFDSKDAAGKGLTDYKAAMAA